MSALEIIMLIGGVVLFIVSFLIPDKKSEQVVKDEQTTKDQVQKIVSSTMEESEKTLAQLTNDKMQAINEYSSTVMEDIHKNHDEVVYLYDLLNQKEQAIKEDSERDALARKEAAEKEKAEREEAAQRLAEAKQEIAKREAAVAKKMEENEKASKEAEKTSKEAAAAPKMKENEKVSKEAAAAPKMEENEKASKEADHSGNVDPAKDRYTNISAVSLGMRNHQERANQNLSEIADEPVDSLEKTDLEPKVITSGFASEIFAQMEKAAGDTVAAAINAAIIPNKSDASKDAAKEIKESATKDAAKEIKESASKDAAKEIKESASKDAAKEIKESASKDDSKEVKEEVSNDLNDSENIAKEEASLVAEKIVNAFSLFDEDDEDEIVFDNNAEILRLHKLGKSNAEIANALGISVGEVKITIDLS